MAGHSFGGQTASMMLGADFVDDDGTKIFVPDARVKAGVLMATTGAAGDHLTEASTRFAPFRTAGFAAMTTATLVVVGDNDFTWELSSKGAEYHADPYTFAPGPKSLLARTLFAFVAEAGIDSPDEPPPRCLASSVARRTAHPGPHARTAS